MAALYFVEDAPLLEDWPVAMGRWVDVNRARARLLTYCHLLVESFEDARQLTLESA